MGSESLTETQHLEPWIIANPGTIDPTLKIVTTQFNRWRAEAGSATERLDILALATSGELVVIELKRASDRNIHLQAITYGALVSGFDFDALGAVHADWLTKQRGTRVAPDAALAELQSHVDTWSEDLLRLPRLILVAEAFPPQVLTTVKWLSTVAPQLQIECHQYTVFNSGAGVIQVAFDRMYPVGDIEDQILRPGIGEVPSTSLAQRASNQRRAKSVVIIHQFQAIP
ncbi:MAG: hypothetical protein QOE61_4855, partial [Micromonosporaceae bacterium]|nr:hypothetical protein [Micromonosporaceae bacterium]